MKLIKLVLFSVMFSVLLMGTAQAADDLPNAGLPIGNLALWNLLVGFGMPYVIAFFNQPGWNAILKSLCTVVLCVAAGTITLWVNGEMNFHDWATSVLTVLASAVVWYKTLWYKPANQLEEATALNSSKE